MELKFRIRKNSNFLYGIVTENRKVLYNFSTGLKTLKGNFNERKQRFNSNMSNYNYIIEGYFDIFEKYKNKSLRNLQKKIREYRDSFNNPTSKNEFIKKYNYLPEVRWLQQMITQNKHRYINTNTVVNFWEYLNKNTELRQSTKVLYSKKLHSLIKKEYEGIFTPVTPKYKHTDNRNNYLSVILSDDDIKLIKEYNFENKKYKYFQSLMLIQYYTAVRFSDLIKIKNTDIDNDENILTVYTQKNRKVIKIPITNEIKQLILYVNEFKTVKIDIANHYYKKICELVGINYEINVLVDGDYITEQKYNLITTHTVRRSRITNLLQQGLSYTEIKSLTGHSSNQLVDRYNKLTPDNKANILKGVNLNF